MRNSKNVHHYLSGPGTVIQLENLINSSPMIESTRVIYVIDEFFRDRQIIGVSPVTDRDLVIYIQTTDEPTTEYIDEIVVRVREHNATRPRAIVAIGGGITLDCGKAISNLLTNGGHAADYQGWDLVKIPGIYKIGIPTVSGTGAEASRTCVMTNKKKNLKLGMNSEHTIYDQLILDPELTETVPRNQYFYSGMDTYIHCVESLKGSHRHAIADSLSYEALRLCREIYLADNMMALLNREKLMAASYLGGCAIANSYVGVVHPFSAGLSVVFGLHHCIANCIVMNQMEEFYADETREFTEMVRRQKVEIPKGICRNLSDTQHQQLYEATVIHEKPLSNALGNDFRSILTFEKVKSIFKRM